jgi:hypothetical protein
VQAAQLTVQRDRRNAIERRSLLDDGCAVGMTGGSVSSRRRKATSASGGTGDGRALPLGLGIGDRRDPELFKGMLCHEHASKRDAVPKMKDGPSKPVCGNRLQTAVSCFRRKTAVVNVTVKAVEDHGMYE